MDALLELIAGSEFVLANLFEREDGQWQANLRLRKPDAKGEYGQEWGLGQTPYAALTAAMERARDT